MSPKAAGLAVKSGYSNVKVYLQGNPGWEEGGRTLVASDDFILNGNIILVDLRPAKKVKKGHIPRAVNIPFAELEAAEGIFPKNRTAPIVFYGKDEKQAEQAVQIVRDWWEYRKVSVVGGGLKRWKKSGLVLEKGSAATDIHWVRIPAAGEVSIEEFRKVLSERPADKVVLDVRGKDETAAGTFPSALNIPLDEIEARLGEIPVGKEVLIHCTTGARAEMARTILVKNAIPARYCMVDVKCEAGECLLVE
jgi:rhodanese-related sulfurtransferase